MPSSYRYLLTPPSNHHRIAALCAPVHGRKYCRIQSTTGVNSNVRECRHNEAFNVPSSHTLLNTSLVYTAIGISIAHMFGFLDHMGFNTLNSEQRRSITASDSLT